MNDAIDTINAAATAIVSAENRQQQQSSSSSSSLQKRRWGSFWGISSCFGSQKQSKKIGHAVLVPEPSSSRTEGPTIEFRTQTSSVVLPFIAPPSSPASFLQSEPPSAIQSPSGLISFTAASSGMYSPSDPTNMFAVGPYAHETQLVSPPVFSTYTTEPSTAPFTPPPESVQLTTPSSPEVPFARFLGSASQNADVDRKFLSPHHEFQLYQLYPGSPRGQLISPGSGVTNSGTSSPYGDIPRGYPPFLLNSTGANLWPPGWKSLQDSGATTPDPTRTGSVLDRQNSDLGPLTSFSNDDQHMVNHRVSFEITPEEVVRCVERRLAADAANARDSCSDDVAKGHRSTATLGSGKEFNFGSTEEAAESNWWTSEKVHSNETGPEPGPDKNWAFFPMVQPGVS
ncbi:potassium/sodium hyperpolarization-activated cyclic nucleotide-gated channel 4 [Tanacetum coccineum]